MRTPGASTPTATVAGTISGRLESPGGDPLANACVTAYNAAYDVVGGDLTEADGSYAIELLPAGTYRLQFIPCNAGNYLGEYYDDADTLAEATGIPLAEGEDIDLGDADLEVGGRIAGLVENDEGDPLADVCVIAYDTAPGASDESSMSAMTGVDGTFAVPGLETGSYKLLVRDCDNHHNVLEQYWDGARTRGAADPVAVTAGSDHPAATRHRAGQRRDARRHRPRREQRPAWGDLRPGRGTARRRPLRGDRDRRHVHADRSQWRLRPRVLRLR